MPAIVATNVVIGVAWPYIHATAGTAKPSFTATASGGWTYVGATMEGVTIEDNVEPNYHYVEEQSSPTNATAGTGEFTFTMTLAEATLENIQLAVGGTIASGVLTLADERPEIAVYVVGVAPDGDFRSFYVPNAVSAGATGTTFRRTEEQQGWPVTFSATCNRDAIKISDIAGA